MNGMMDESNERWKVPSKGTAFAACRPSLIRIRRGSTHLR